MAFRFTPADRAAFKRCRRQWDFGARERQNLEPVEAATGPDLDLAVRDALAVYYFPGMWDWRRSVVLPLVLQGFARSMGGRPAGTASWSCPTGGRSATRAASTCWPATSTTATGCGPPLVDRFGAADDLLLDEELVAACWAMERFYPGMRIAGTVHNELLRPAVPPVGTDRAAPRAGPRRFGRRRRRRHERGLPQHEASGGGRSLPYARRGVGPRRPDSAQVCSEGDGQFRRTRILRGPAELAAMGARLAAEALDMVEPGLRLYPNPAPEHCGSCRFVAPCLAVERGDVRAVLEAAYRDRGPERIEPGRLGNATWSMGRGAAPPRLGPG